MQRAFIVILALLACFSGQTMANQCLNYMNHIGGACVAEYRYESITKHFHDRHNEPQDVTFHYIVLLSPGSSAIVQLDLDFRFFCSDECDSDIQSAVSSKLWDFRQALIAGSFFVYSDCDADLMPCDTNQHRADTMKEQDKIKMVQPILRLQNMAQNSLDITQFRKQLQTHLKAPTKILVQTGETDYALCIETGESCDLVSGHLVIHDNHTEVSFSHHFGALFNSFLSQWLHEWLSDIAEPHRCATQEDCSLEGNSKSTHCTINYQCNL